MTDQRRWQVAKALREVGIVVLSILIAFGLDAWWNGQVQERELEKSLRAVVLDLEETKTRLTVNAAIRDSVQASLEILLSHAGPRAEPPPIGEMDFLIAQFNRTASLAAVTGAIEAMVQSGQIGSVENDSLRLELAAWDQYLRDFTEDEEYESIEMQSNVRPYLSERVRIFDTGIVGAGGAFANDYEALLRDIRFANLVSIRLRRLRQIHIETEELRFRIDRVIRLIEETLH